MFDIQLPRQAIATKPALIDRVDNDAKSMIFSGALHFVTLLILAMVALPLSGSNRRAVNLLVNEAEEPEILDFTVVEVAMAQRESLDEIVAEHSDSLDFENVTMIQTDVGNAEVELIDFSAKALSGLGVEIPSDIFSAGGLVVRDRKIEREGSPPGDMQLAQLEVPENALTAGSFRLFAEPANPEPAQPYWLIIQLDVPPEIDQSRVKKSDVSGTVRGTDGFAMPIPSPTGFSVIINGIVLFINKPAHLHDKYDRSGRVARWAVYVPGGAQDVEDTIEVRSVALNETQALKLRF